MGDRVGQAVVKMVNNVMSLTNLASCLEGMVLGAKAGIDAEKMLAVINSGSGQNSAGLTGATLRHEPKVQHGGPMYISQKDVTLWRDEGRASGRDAMGWQYGASSPRRTRWGVLAI